MQGYQLKKTLFGVGKNPSGNYEYLLIDQEKEIDNIMNLSFAGWTHISIPFRDCLLLCS